MVRLAFVFVVLGSAAALAAPIANPCLPDSMPTQAPAYPLVRGEAGGKVYEFHVTIDGKAVSLSPPEAGSTTLPETLACTQTS
jgi:hypothetical protein